jgi:ssDNA thymidine ADP-ribosyltransferase, DarT
MRTRPTQSVQITPDFERSCARMSVVPWMIEVKQTVERSRVSELHYITPIANLSSIVERGILSQVRASPLRPESVADADVQSIRDGKRVPNARPLHEYVNLYFDARNPMMYRRLANKNRIVVLRVSPEVMDLSGAVITDGNAASNGTRFYTSPRGLVALDEDRVFAASWMDADRWVYFEKKRQRCAEILVPDVVPVEYIFGCYACADDVRAACERANLGLEVRVRKDVYFG